jgi:hypothetical protein
MILFERMNGLINGYFHKKARLDGSIV